MKHFYVFLFLIFTCANSTIAKEAMAWKSLLAQCPPDVESAIVVQVPYDQTGFLIEGVMEMLGEEIWTSESPTAPPPAPIQKTKTKIPRALFEFPGNRPGPEGTMNDVEVEGWIGNHLNVRVTSNLLNDHYKELQYVVEMKRQPTEEDPYPAGRLWIYGPKNELKSVKDYDGRFRFEKSCGGYAGEFATMFMDSLIAYDLELSVRYLGASNLEGLVWFNSKQYGVGWFFVFKQDIAEEFGNAYQKCQAQIPPERLKESGLDGIIKVLPLNSRILFATYSSKLKAWFENLESPKENSTFEIPNVLTQRITPETRICFFCLQKPETVWMLESETAEGKQASGEILILGTPTQSPEELGSLPYWKHRGNMPLFDLPEWKKMGEKSNDPLNWYRWSLPDFDPHALLLQDGKGAFIKYFISSIVEIKLY